MCTQAGKNVMQRCRESVILISMCRCKYVDVYDDEFELKHSDKRGEWKNKRCCCDR